MSKKFISLIFILVTLNTIVVLCHKDDDEGVENSYLRKNIIQQLKTLFKNIKVSPNNNQQDNSLHILPPKYMIELYQKYSQDKVKYEDSNSVRCIFGNVKRGSIHFNLSSVPTESIGHISHSEVHVYIRKSRHGTAARSKFKVPARSSSKKFLSTIVKLAHTKGWQILNITKTIKSYKRKGKYLKMTVEAPIPAFGKAQKRYSTLALNELLYVTYKPFLLIYSNEPKENWAFSFPSLQPEFEFLPEGEKDLKYCNINEFTHSQVKSHISSNTKYNNDFDKYENNLNFSLNAPNKRNGDESENLNYDIDLDSFRRVEQQLSNEDMHFMSKRSIQDNQLTPDDFESYHTSNNIPYNLISSFVKDDALSALHLMNVSNRNTVQDYDVDDEWNPVQEDDYTTFLLPFLGKQKSQHFPSPFNKVTKRKEIKRKDSKWSNKQINIERFVFGNKHHNDDELIKPISTTSAPPQQITPISCPIEKLYIELENEWAGKIIAPPTFQYNFCNGSCIDLQREENEGFDSENNIPTLADQEGFSSSCCAPVETKQLSILYIDIHDTIVLQSFPNVTTTSCECQ